MNNRTKVPLEGLTVVAIEQAVAAPFCSSRLADAGARVIKIERPEGDFARGYDDVAKGLSSYFVWLNRGKESVVADLTSIEGKELLHNLISEADIVLQNLKPGSLERLGFGIQQLSGLHPEKIFCSITGYADTGPLSGRKAYDLLIQAESGLCSITGGPDEPSRVGISIVDIATGATAYSAILEALIARSATGKGADIRISMFDVIADWLTVPLLNHEGGQSPQRVGMAHPSIAPYGVYTTSDKKQILISIQSDREWRTLSKEFLKKIELAENEQFATNVARVKNRAETDKLVASAFASYDKKTAIEKLTKADIAFALVNDMEGLSTHPELRRISIETANGTVSYPAPAPVFFQSPRTYGKVPALGENRMHEKKSKTR